eukprot:GABV01004976.1.p2 GENE.GABV01004976.1~~GABV01004976.1.p2  ORF type:complete len:109 (+),score=47.92 GABV01004976.1:59-385(+)
MKHLAAYMMLVLSGTANPTADDVKKVLAAIDATVDEDRLNKVVEQLQGKDLDALIAEGKEKLSSVPTGAVGGGAAAGAGAGEAEAEAEPEPEPESSSSDEDMGFSLFD